MGGPVAPFITLATFNEGADASDSSLDAQLKKITAALAAEAIAGELVDIYPTLGAFDLVVITEIPTADGAAAFGRALRELSRGTSVTLTAVEPKTVDAAAAPMRELMRPAVGRPAVGRDASAH